MDKFILTSDSSGSYGMVLAEGRNEPEREAALRAVDQSRVFRVNSYFFRSAVGGVSIQQIRYGLDETCKSGEWKIMEGPHTVRISSDNGLVLDLLREVLDTKDH